MEINDSQLYLGMQLILRPGAVIIDMVNSVERLMNCGEDALREFTSPAGKDIFSVDEKSQLLSEKTESNFIQMLRNCYIC